MWFILGLIAYFPLKALLKNTVMFEVVSWSGERTGKTTDLIPKWTVMHTIFTMIISIILGYISVGLVLVIIGYLAFNNEYGLKEGTWLSKESKI